MTDNSVVQQQLKQLKSKLDAAISSRSALEEDFNKRATMLTDFIGKLSRVSKGLDLELDNRLAKLRSRLKKSAPVDEIEAEIDQITKLLIKQASQNETNIREMHHEFHHAGSILQKAKGIPPLLRRNLRELLTENKDAKDALIKYVPKLSELLAIYAQVLAAKNDVDAGGQGKIGDKPQQSSSVDVGLFAGKVSELIGDIKLSGQQQTKLEKVKNSIAQCDTVEELILHYIVEIFQIVTEDIEQERDTAKAFISTISGALLKLQRSLKSSILNTSKQKKLHKRVNDAVKQQLGEMISVVESASSLSEARVVLTEQVGKVAQTLEAKSVQELEYYKSIEAKLAQTQTKVAELEQQSKYFEKRWLEQQKKSMLDALTKLNNRAAFDEYVAKTMVRFHHENFDLAISVIDLDNFKSINDTFGHTAGDKTLQVVASMLTKCVGDSAFIARYGGEEFVLLFEKLTAKEVESTLNNLRENIAKLPFKFKNTKLHITTSIGATHVKKGDNIHQAFERADQALYQAKNSGKNQVIYAS